MKCAIFGQISGLITLRQETPFYTACTLSDLVQLLKGWTTHSKTNYALKDCVLPNNSKNNVVKMLVKTLTQRPDYDSKAGLRLKGESTPLKDQLRHSKASLRTQRQREKEKK